MRADRGRGPEAGAGERVADGADDEGAHEARVAEAHLRLGRMHVDVDLPRIAGDAERQDGMAVAGHDVGIGAAHGPEQELVAHGAAVDDEVDVAGAAAVEGRQPCRPGEREALARGRDGDGIGREIDAEHARGAAQEAGLVRVLGRIGERRQTLASQREADRRVRDGEAAHGLGDRLRLGPVGFEEFQARRGGGEEVSDLDAGAGRRRGRPHRPLQAEIDGDGRAGRRARRARHDRQARHGADGGQRLAAEAEGGDGEQVAVRQLRGGVALDGEVEIGRRHAAAVVDDADQPAAAALDRHRNAAGAGIDGVLDEFLDGGGGPLDHLARGDAVDEDRIEPADGHPSLTHAPPRGIAWRGPCPPPRPAGRRGRRRGRSR